jgi:hypothetical protein
MEKFLDFLIDPKSLMLIDLTKSPFFLESLKKKGFLFAFNDQNNTEDYFTILQNISRYDQNYYRIFCDYDKLEDNEFKKNNNHNSFN